jgi:phytoene/squalene synthetase
MWPLGGVFGAFAKLDAVYADRYQWWRDALTSLSENVAPAKHPVLTALWHVNTSSRLSKYQLKRLLDTR